MATQTKEEILANLLKKSLGLTLKKLETQTCDHIKSLEQTRKCFNAHQKALKDLNTRVKIAKELKEAKEKKLLEAKKKQQLTKSLTSKNLRAKTATHNKSNLNKTMSFIKITKKLNVSRSFTTERKSDNKPFKSKAVLTAVKKNLSSRAVTQPSSGIKTSMKTKSKKDLTACKSQTLFEKKKVLQIPKLITEIPEKENIEMLNRTVMINNSRYRPMNTAKYSKRPKEIQKEEILSIQETIKNIQINLDYTAKIISHKKTASMNAIDENSKKENEKSKNENTTNSNTEKTPRVTFKENVVIKKKIEAPKVQTQNIKKIVYKDILTSNNNDYLKKIGNFLTIKEKLDFYSICKAFSSLQKSEIIMMKIKKIDKELEEYKSKFNEKEEIEKDYKEFKLSKGASRAILCLNEEVYNKIFVDNISDLKVPIGEIAIIFRILHQLLKNDSLLNIQKDEEFWLKNCEWILKDSNKEIGSFLMQESKKFHFDIENVLKLKSIAKDYKTKLTPSYFSNICPTTCLIIFLVKDALEYCGALNREKITQPRRVFEVLNYEKGLLEKDLSKLNESSVK